jgi:hypothetical protein
MDRDIRFSRHRSERARRQEADYRSWLEQRPAASSHPDPAHPVAGLEDRHEGALESLGRAISEAVRGVLPTRAKRGSA